jgi:hypothetical protein
MDKSLPWDSATYPHGQLFLAPPKTPKPEKPHHSPTNIPGDDEKMKNQNERNEWNKRWIRQITLWQAEVKDLMDQADALMALIDLAKAQIKRDPPE